MYTQTELKIVLSSLEDRHRKEDNAIRRVRRNWYDASEEEVAEGIEFHKEQKHRVRNLINKVKKEIRE